MNSVGKSTDLGKPQQSNEIGQTKETKRLWQMSRHQENNECAYVVRRLTTSIEWRDMSMLTRADKYSVI